MCCGGIITSVSLAGDIDSQKTHEEDLVRGQSNGTQCFKFKPSFVSPIPALKEPEYKSLGIF